MNIDHKIQPNDMAQVYITGEYPKGWFGKSEHRVNPNGYGMEFHVPVIPKLVVERIHPDAVLPTYASEGDSGMDVYSPVDVLIHPQEAIKIGAGFKLGIPRHPLHELGYRWEVQIRPRSGISLNTEIKVTFGTGDNGYRGELGVIIKNDAQKEYDVSLDVEKTDGYVDSVKAEYEVSNQGFIHDLKSEFVTQQTLSALGLSNGWCDLPKGTMLIRKGDRIAQLVFNEVIRPMEIVERKVDANTDRGTGGFGSSGV